MNKVSVIAAICFFLISGLGTQAVNAQNESLGKATDFELKDINGSMVKLSSYQGKVIILNFFATWCPPCRMEMPDFNRIAQERPNDVAIIAVNVGDENESAIRNFVDQNKLTFPVAKDDGKVSSAYGPIRAIPVTVVIDKDLNIVRQYVGARTKAIFENDIDTLNKSK